MFYSPFQFTAARNIFDSSDHEFKETVMKVLTNFFYWEICDHGSSIEELSDLENKYIWLSASPMCFCMLTVAVSLICM